MYNPYGYSAPLQDNLAAYRAPYYQPPMAQQMPYAGQTAVQNPMQTSASTDRTFVLDVNEAKGYLVAPGNTVFLWDSKAPRIYVKSVAVNGVPSMQILEYTDISASAESPAQPERYVTREEFEAFRAQLKGANNDE